MHSLINFWLMTNFKNKFVDSETRSNTCMMQTGRMEPVTRTNSCIMEIGTIHTPCKQQLKLYNESRDLHLHSMEIGMYYNPDVIKSYFSYICHTPAREIPTLTASPLSYRISPFLWSPPPFSNFSIPLFLGIFGKINLPFLGGGRGEGSNYARLLHYSCIMLRCQKWYINIRSIIWAWNS